MESKQLCKKTAYFIPARSTVEEEGSEGLAREGIKGYYKECPQVWKDPGCSGRVRSSAGLDFEIYRNEVLGGEMEGQGRASV